jgi:hypothetical protein
MQMQKSWTKIFGNAILYDQMLQFEKEENDLLNNTPNASLFLEKAKLRSKYKDLFEHTDIQDFISASVQYKKMVENCITELWDTFDIKLS